MTGTFFLGGGCVCRRGRRGGRPTGVLLHPLPCPEKQLVSTPERFLPLGFQIMVGLPEAQPGPLLERGEVVIQEDLLFPEVAAVF
jgi:hypothetical protein